jgi:hypothetical protein
MHVGWNFFQGPIFGYAASGHDTPVLVAQAPSGPAWLSGGAFGPEGSVLTIPVVAAALLAMRWWAGRRQAAVTGGSGRGFPFAAVDGVDSRNGSAAGA